MDEHTTQIFEELRRIQIRLGKLEVRFNRLVTALNEQAEKYLSSDKPANQEEADEQDG